MKSVRLSIDVNGRQRILFSVSSRSNKPLIIGMRPAAFYRPAGTLPRDDLEDLKIIEQKYTFHHTLHSKHNSNGYHHTLLLTRGPQDNKVSYTQALKMNNQFAPLFAKRFDSLLIDANDPGEKRAATINIGEINQDYFTLFSGVYLSKAERSFAIEPQSDLNILQWIGHDFAVTFIWSFIPLPTYCAGLLTHYRTVEKEEEIMSVTNLDVKKLISGYNENDCLESFRLARTNSLCEMVRLISMAGDDADGFIYFCSNQIITKNLFYKEGLDNKNALRDFAR